MTHPPPFTAKRKTRVLLLIHELTLTGAPNLAFNAFSQMTGQIDLRTVSLGTPLDAHQLARFQTLGPVLVINGAPPGPPLKRILGAGVRRLNARLKAPGIRRWKPSVIYVNSIVALAIAQRMRLPDAPLILHVHELESYLDEMIQTAPDLVLRRPDRYIAASESVRRAMLGFGIPDEKIGVITTFIRERDFDQPITPVEISAWGDGAPRREGEPAPFVVGGVGVSAWRKGDTLWMLMAAELKRLLGDRVRFLAVGIKNDDPGRNLRLMARKLGLTSSLEIIPITREPLKYLARCDVVAVTSWEEPASMVSLDAMMLRKPVACFAGAGGPPELLGETGVVVEAFSPADMARAIAELAGSPETCHRLGQAARDRASSTFTDTLQVPRILAEIQALANRAG